MFRVLSRHRSGYDRLVDESSSPSSSSSMDYLEFKLSRSRSLAAKVVFGSSRKNLGNLPPASCTEKQVKKASKIHPFFSIFERRRGKKATANPEFARYLEYLKEGGLWDVNSNT